MSLAVGKEVYLRLPRSCRVTSRENVPGNLLEPLPLSIELVTKRTNSVSLGTGKYMEWSPPPNFGGRQRGVTPFNDDVRSQAKLLWTVMTATE